MTDSKTPFFDAVEDIGNRRAAAQAMLAALKNMRRLVREGGVPRYTITPGAALNSIIEESIDPAIAQAEAAGITTGEDE